MALRHEADAAGRGGCVASGREAGARGGVVEEAVPCEAENADLRAVQKAMASPKLSPRRILSSIIHRNVSNHLTTDTHRALALF